MRREEKIIQERRTIEATKKNLMGLAGKFGVIVRYLGYPIVGEGSGYVDSHYLDDPYDLVDEGEIPVAQDHTIVPIGYAFDGLSGGCHIEIQYTENRNEIVVYYKGFKVYHEIGGDLLGYAPFDEWENIINRLYKSAEKKRKKTQEGLKVITAQEVKSQKKSFLRELRERWGI